MSRSDASPETPPVGAPVDAARDAKADAPRPLYRDFTLRILPTPAVQRREFGLMDADGLDAEDAAEDAAESAPIAVAISSEAPVERWDWMTGERYYEVLDHTAKGGPDLSYAADGLPFCLDHDLGRQIGLLDGLSLDGDRMLRGVITPGNHPDAPWVFADMRDGIRKKVSIGYLPGEQYTVTPAKKKGDLPTRRYTGWLLYEASSVSVPADYAVGVGRAHPGLASGHAATGDVPAVPAAPRTDADRSAASELSPAPLTVADDTARNMETRMADESVTTASTREAAILAAEKDRTTELARIAKEYGQHERLADWISGNVSVKAASDEVMNALRAKVGAPVQNAEPVVTGYKEREEDKPYNSMGEFLRDVVIAGRAGGMVAPQLRTLRAASGQGESMPSDGGFALQPAFATEIRRVMFETGKILSRVEKLPIGDNSNSAKILALKENSRQNGSRLGGITSYYADEGDTIPTSKAQFRTVDLNLRKLVAAVPTSDELLQDTVLTDALIRKIVPEEMIFRTEDAIINGTGAGQALGVLNSPALIVQAIEGSQTIANTNQYIWFNVAKMISRMTPGSFLKSAWFIQQAIWAKILTATAGTGNPAAPIFMPPGSLADAPFGSIYGRPIIPIEQAAAEGTVGDIVLADMSQYLFIDKGGINAAQSMHVRFLQDENVLRWTYRFDGAPGINSPITPFTGSNTLSPFVALAARS